MPDDPRFMSAFASAQQVLQMASDYEVPPTPQIFEVLLNYITGMDADLSAEVRKSFTCPVDERETELCKIYDEHLGPAALHKGLTKISQGLTSEIAEISSQVTNGLKGNLELAGDLRQSLRGLAEQITKDDLRGICKDLRGANQTHLATTQNLSTQLQKTQHQLNEMQQELTVLRKSASTDHLTGLPNRRYLDERLNQFIVDKQPFCFAMLDLDKFKSINDTWGHSVGDNILRRLGELLRQNIKGRDIACRVGGEEFALILPHTSLVGAQTLCEGIGATFAAITWITQSSEEEIGTLTLSGGVTCATNNDSFGSIYERADKLLYEAKETGRNRIVAG